MVSDKPKLHERMRRHRAGQLRTIALDVTPKCNMRCSHCYAETFRRAKPVSLESLLDALDEFHELGVFHYILQGGEPITAPGRLEAILRNCHAEETYINVVSNGWRMTRNRIQWLKALKVDKIAFSLDSGIEEEHDANRLPGSYRKVLEAIDNVLAEGLLASVSIVVTHESLYSAGFRLAYEFAVQRRIRLDVQIAEPVGKWDGMKEELITAADAAYIRKLRDASGHLPNGQVLINRDIFSGEKEHCPAGTEFMAVSGDGQFLPCNFLQYTLGTIGDRPIKAMRDDLLASPWFDGCHPSCLCGENEEFIDRYIVPFKKRAKPLSAYQVFELDSGKE